jgi:hypothetical protein
MPVTVVQTGRATTAAPNVTTATSSDHGDNAALTAAQKEASATATTGNAASHGHSYQNFEACEKAVMINGDVGIIESSKNHHYDWIKGKDESKTVCGNMNGDVFLKLMKS